MKKLLAGVAAFAMLTSGGIFLQQTLAQDATSTQRYLPEYNDKGELLLPKNFERWVFVGSPLTPNALNGGQANFPEFHNVYIEPGSYDIYQKTGVLPEGTIFLKELQLTLPKENADGSRTEPSGGRLLSRQVQRGRRHCEGHQALRRDRRLGLLQLQPLRAEGQDGHVKSKDECSYCHQASAEKDDIWTQFYPRLDH
jgi:Cytochrome P460